MQTEKERIENMVQAIRLANDIFKVVQKPEFVKYPAQERYQTLYKLYPNFAKAYPIVLRYMAIYIKYSETAFRQFFDKLNKEPGKGMAGFIERQADYVKFLYIAWEKEHGGHWSMKRANRIWQSEYESMSRVMREIEKAEKETRNEFAEDKEKHLKERRRELLEFVQSQPQFSDDDDEPVYQEKSAADIDINNLDERGMHMLFRQLREYEDELLDNLAAANAEIERLEARLYAPKKKREKPAKPTLDLDWVNFRLK